MDDRESAPIRRRVPLWAIAFGLGVALAVAVGYPRAVRPPAPPAPAAVEPPPPAEAHAPAPPPIATPRAPATPLAPGGTLELSRADFPASGPVVVKLALAEPSTEGAPRRVRIFSIDDRHGIETQASLDPSLAVASLELDPSFLQPGNYFVEVQTTERSHAPVRRYAIVVR